ncbi:hypothetical protein E3_0430 [Rhodococcus phage E3]|uniref:hypothetical protein n=1 Tax=Rhodococcus phage E3 TaxID=1007869 RepID=UPI0002C6B64B|nr:hypothetical protein M176_gp046 [Rhodococcus phage E3]AEQ20956.1 hypothetical protein E3_0430 [Rhodococcus phage E3]
MAKEIDWQANERIGEVVWSELRVEGLGDYMTYAGRLGMWGAVIFEYPASGKLLVTVGPLDGAGEHFWFQKDALDDAKVWAEVRMRQALARTHAKLDELSALEQEMGLY